jgi:hypothetical protein
MALRVLYLIFLRLLGPFLLLSRSPGAKDCELLALPHGDRRPPRSRRVPARERRQTDLRGHRS